MKKYGEIKKFKSSHLFFTSFKFRLEDIVRPLKKLREHDRNAHATAVKGGSNKKNGPKVLRFIIIDCKRTRTVIKNSLPSYSIIL